MNRFLFIGLGNPGDQYDRTRHNAGWFVLDELVQRWSDSTIPPTWKYEKKIDAEVCKITFGQNEVVCLKPQTYMNESGKTAAAAAKWYLDIDPTVSEDQEFSHIVVFHDDLDLVLGQYKLQFNSGPKIHNGVNSVRQHLHSTHLWTARIGVDTRQGDRSIPGKAYVLQRFSPEEKQTLKQVTQYLAEELPYVVLQ